MSLFSFARPLLFALPPEEAHEVTLKSLERGLYLRTARSDPPALSVNVAGLSFPNPLGIAAGFDKDARVPDAVLGLGCGFAEIGTVTPLPQSGNPKPRVFRLVAEQAAHIPSKMKDSGGWRMLVIESAKGVYCFPGHRNRKAIGEGRDRRAVELDHRGRRPGRH